jgi:hypothetical protein
MMGILSDIDRLIRNTLQFRGDAGGHKKEPYIRADRLLQRRQLNGVVVDFNLEIIDFLLLPVDLGGALAEPP